MPHLLIERLSGRSRNCKNDVGIMRNKRYKRTHTHIYMQIHTHTHTHTNAHTHSCTHARTQPHVDVDGTDVDKAVNALGVEPFHTC